MQLRPHHSAVLVGGALKARVSPGAGQGVAAGASGSHQRGSLTARLQGEVHHAGLVLGIQLERVVHDDVSLLGGGSAGGDPTQGRGDKATC